jgi:hypothetical protein
MRIEFMPGMTNVVRFPLEVRVEPSLELLLDIAPDCREVDSVAEAFDLDRRLHEARGAADLAMAEHILNYVAPERGARRRLALDGLLQPLIGKAVDACRLAHRAGEDARRANQRLVEAQIEGGYWIDALNDIATEKSNEAARCLIEAHIASEEAQGAARAVSIAKRGEEWRPFNLRTEEEALFFGAAST